MRFQPLRESTFALDHGKLRAFIAVGFAASTAAFLLFLVLFAPIVLLGGANWRDAISGAIGCGIGTGVVNAAFAAWNN